MRRSNLFWGFVLLLVGLLLLLDNLGLLGDISIWSVIWPLLVITLGAWILWRSLFRKPVESEHVVIPLESAQRARVRIQHGAGRLNVNSGAGVGNFLEGDFQGGLDYKTRLDEENLDVRMRVPSQSFPFNWGPGYSLDWDVEIQKDLPISLELNTGASDTRLNMRDLLVDELILKSGASSTSIILPANAGSTRVEVETGAASVDLKVPEGVAARILSSGGLSSLSVDRNRFPRADSGYQSEDYDTAENKVDIRIQMGVGSASVRSE